MMTARSMERTSLASEAINTIAPVWVSGMLRILTLPAELQQIIQEMK